MVANEKERSQLQTQNVQHIGAIDELTSTLGEYVNTFVGSADQLNGAVATAESGLQTMVASSSTAITDFSSSTEQQLETQRSDINTMT